MFEPVEPTQNVWGGGTLKKKEVASFDPNRGLFLLPHTKLVEPTPVPLNTSVAILSFLFHFYFPLVYSSTVLCISVYFSIHSL